MLKNEDIPAENKTFSTVFALYLDSPMPAHVPFLRAFIGGPTHPALLLKWWVRLWSQNNSVYT